MSTTKSPRRARELTPFGRWVKTQVIDQGKTIDGLAKEVGTSKDYLSVIIHGVKPGRKYIHPIIKALDGDSEMLKDIL